MITTRNLCRQRRFCPCVSGIRRFGLAAGLAILCPFVLPFAAKTAWAQKTAKQIFEQVSPSVVSILGQEGGSGTGVVLDHSGLILTNEHVIESAGAMRCIVDVKNSQGRIEATTFDKVTVIGVHPEQDLALIRINGLEKKGEVFPATLTKKKVTEGDAIIAIGNPGAGGQVLKKTITSGLISGTDRVLSGITYYQVDAAINPGNSGGPVVNDEGEVIGIATLKFLDAENVGFVLPIHSFKVDSIKPAGRDQTNSQKARTAIDTALGMLETMRKTNSEPARTMLQILAAQKYHEAGKLDPENAAVFYNLGMILDRNGGYKQAVSFLTHSLKLSPWGMQDDRVYRQLSVSLGNEGRDNESRLAAEEGTLKFPRSGWCWALLAVDASRSENHADAAFNSSLVLHLKPGNVDLKPFTTLRDESLAKLEGESRNEVQSRIDNIPAFLDEREAAARKAEQDGTKWVSGTFGEFTTKAEITNINSVKHPLLSPDSFFLESTAYHQKIAETIAATRPAGHETAHKTVDPAEQSVPDKGSSSATDNALDAATETGADDKDSGKQSPSTAPEEGAGDETDDD